MKTKKILILGSTGMLGSMVLDFLSKQEGLKITAPLRKELKDTSFKGYDYIINCIGIIKPKLKDPAEAILVNSLFPYELAEERSKNCKVIQIATDCVFSGNHGGYYEDDSHDANDMYGKTKSLGEVNAKNFFNIRCSIIGIDKKKLSLLSWFLAQKEVTGFNDHWWNGVTTLQFAKLCYAIIKNDLNIPNLTHFVPKDSVNKYQLLKIFKKAFNKDIKVKIKHSDYLDRTLSTLYPLANTTLWERIGYLEPLSIEEMVEEFALWVK